MYLRGDIYYNVDSTMAAVHGQILCLHGTLDAIRAQNQLPSVTDPLESDSDAAGPRSSSSSMSYYPHNFSECLFLSLF